MLRVPENDGFQAKSSPKVTKERGQETIHYLSSRPHKKGLTFSRQPFIYFLA